MAGGQGPAAEKAVEGERLTVTREDGVARITFDDPERHNALTPAMSAALRDAVEALAPDRDVRVVVLRGAGDRAFMSGADIGGLPDELPTPGAGAAGGDADDAAARQARFTAGGPGVLLRLPQPVIALVHGWCLGGGLLTALCADLRVASDDAVFGIPAARLGVGYPYPAAELLVHLAGAAAASEVLLTGERFGAADAQRLGLVHRVVPKADLDAAVDTLATTVAANAPLTLIAAKRSIRAVLGGSRADDVAAAESAVAACWASEDFREGRQAFAEKRRPRFAGR
jgi:enoyl-CoA hydratase/carnithine racemase